MAVAGVVGYVLWLLSGALVHEGNWIALDFHVYYQAARALWRGEDIYLAGISPPYIYPPLLAILVLPLSALHVTPATIIWKLFQHICLLAAGWLLVKLLPAPIRPLCAGALLLGLPTIIVKSEIREGQVNSLILLLTVSAIYAILKAGWNNGSEISRVEEQASTQNPEPTTPSSSDGNRYNHSLLLILAGILLAFAVGIKVLPALMIAYLWWRGPRITAAVATGGFLALQLVCLLVTPATLRYWLEVFPGLFSEAFHSPDNQSLNAAISRALLPGEEHTPSTQLLDGAEVRPIATWLANIATLMLTAWTLRLSGRRAPLRSQAVEGRTIRKLLEISLTLLTIHLVSGSTWPHHLVTLCVSVTALLGAWWLGQRSDHKRRGGWLAPLVALGAGVAVLLRTPEEWLTLMGASAPGNAPLALIASNATLFVVIALWLATTAMLIRKTG